MSLYLLFLLGVLTPCYGYSQLNRGTQGRTAASCRDIVQNCITDYCEGKAARFCKRTCGKCDESKTQTDLLAPGYIRLNITRGTQSSLKSRQYATDKAYDNDMNTLATTSRGWGPGIWNPEWMRFYFAQSKVGKVIARGYSGSSEDVHYVFVYDGEDKSLCDTFTAVKGPYVQTIQCRDTVGQSVTVEVNDYINMYEIEIYGKSFVGCQDVVIHCKPEYCKWTDMAYKKCRKTCGKCGETAPVECKDERIIDCTPDHVCKWTGTAKHCKKTCGMCIIHD